MAFKRVSWYCANRSCNNGEGTVLGTIVSDELVLEKDNVETLNTSGVALVVTCKNCGTVKVWYPTLELCIVGAVNALRRELTKSTNVVTK